MNLKSLIICQHNSSQCEFLIVMKKVQEYNSDEMFILLVEKRKGVFKNVSGQPKYKCHL